MDSGRGEFCDSVRLGNSLVLLIECKRIEARVDERWQRLSHALDLIVEDPEIQAGAPTFKGTRVLVWLVIEALRLGEPEAEILEHYPALTHATLEAAKLYADVRPRRGRPKRSSDCSGLRDGMPPEYRELGIES
jgi:uncharacterized protein (DUF433 family)